MNKTNTYFSLYKNYYKANTIHQSLNNTPYEFDIDMAIMLLLKTTTTPKTIKIRALNTLHTVPYEIKKIDFINDNESRINTYKLNLGGLNSPLPDYLTEKMIQKKYNYDFAMQDFFDIFVNRLVKKSFEINKKLHHALQDTEPQNTVIGKILHSFYGKYAHSLHKIKTTSELEKILKNFLNTTVHIQDFQQNIATHNMQCKLTYDNIYNQSINKQLFQAVNFKEGKENTKTNSNDTTQKEITQQIKLSTLKNQKKNIIYTKSTNALKSAVIGNKFYNQQYGIVINIYGDYQQLTHLLNGQSLNTLKTIIRQYCGDLIEYHIHIHSKNMKNGTIKHSLLGRNFKLLQNTQSQQKTI